MTESFRRPRSVDSCYPFSWEFDMFHLILFRKAWGIGQTYICDFISGFPLTYLIPEKVQYTIIESPEGECRDDVVLVSLFRFRFLCIYL